MDEKPNPRNDGQTTNSSAAAFNNLEYQPLPLIFKDPPVFVPSAAVAGMGHDEKEYALEWNRFTSVEEYKRSGKTHATWDAHALAAIEAYAQARSTPSDSEPKPEIIAEIGREASAAVTAGCDDPLVRYLHARYAMILKPGMTDAILAESYGTVAKAMESMPYSPLRKAYASLRAAEELHLSVTNFPLQLIELRRSGVHHVNETLHDRMMPPHEASDICSVLWSICGNNKMMIRQIDETVLPTLDKFWADYGFTYLLKGRVYIRKAWDARGGGYAPSVTEEGWKEFKAQLDLSEKALRKAWALDQKDANIAVSMLTICLGKSYPRREMELWFKRAMDIDPACFEAVQSKALYLEPKWLGSAQEVLQFGTECVASTRWKGKVPVILAGIHDSLCGYLDENDQPRYWQDPAVWKDLQRSYERFFELNPKNVSYRHNYARHAYLCGKYQTFLAQLTYFQGTNYAYFGGQPAFEEMIRNAQAKTGVGIPKR